MKYRAIFIGGILGLGLVGQVQAQDAWRGAYVGLSAEAGKTTGQIDGSGGHSYDAEGATLGLYGGYNFAKPGSNFVWGPELALSGFGADESVNSATLGTSDFSGSFVLSARLRAGYATQKTYFYGIAGLAMTDGGIRPAGNRETDLTTAPQIGLGAEFAMANGWSTRIDATQTKLDGRSYSFNGSQREVSTKLRRISIGLSRNF